MIIIHIYKGLEMLFERTHQYNAAVCECYRVVRKKSDRLRGGALVP